MSKKDLVLQFYEYSESVLEQLHVIASCILNPNLNQLVEVNFSKMVDLVFKTGGLADTYFPEWTDRSKVDFGRFLVELFALFSDKDFFYINHFHKESFISTAELYRSLVHKGISNGYNVQKNNSATAVFVINFAPGIGKFVERGEIQIGIQNLTELTFVNESFTLIENVKGHEITFIHGVNKSINGTISNRSIMLIDKNISANSIKLSINGELWSSVDSFYLGISSTKHYMVLQNQFGQVELVFAPAEFGYVPSIGTDYSVDYIVGGGSVGNLLAGTLTSVLKNITGRNILSFFQPETSGGSTLLSLEGLRQNIIGSQRTLNRLVTAEDGITLCKNLSFVYNAFAQKISNYWYLFIVTKTEELLSESQLDELEEYFSDKLSPDDSIHFENPHKQEITMVLDVYVLSNYDITAKKIQIETLVEELLSPLHEGDFGVGVIKEDFAVKILSRISGVQNVDFQVLHKGIEELNVSEDILVYPNELVDYNNSIINVNVINE
jgi:hypothetical protein